MLKTVEIIINGETFSVPDNVTILEAAKINGIKIPSLCHFPDQRVKANCRVCVVEVEGSKNLVASCSTPVRAGMNVRTTSSRVRETVQTILELIFANHPQECLTCIRNANCELRELAAQHGLREIKCDMSTPLLPLDTSTSAIVRDPNKCIKCGRCAEVCHHVQTTGILYSHYRGINGAITPEYGKTLSKPNRLKAVTNLPVAIVPGACPISSAIETRTEGATWTTTCFCGSSKARHTAPVSSFS